MDHLRELQGRLFSTVFVFIIVAAIAYPFFDKITEFLLAPLKPGQELVYLTPGGAFSFIIKICAYIGLIGTLPIIIYHLYRFIMPAVRQTSIRRVLAYTVGSMLLAVMGVLFAYYVILPAALQFLTGFNLNHIDAMLTIDSYFSFIMTYMLAGALLFQLPLVMLIINSVKPLTPKKLMGAQRHVIVGSFIIAAIISPTPDALNQSLLASPVVVMYQVGIILIWRVNARARRRERKQQKALELQPVAVASKPIVPVPVPAPVLAPVNQSAPKVQSIAQVQKTLSAPNRGKSMDMVHRPTKRPIDVSVPKRQTSIIMPERPVQPSRPAFQGGMRTMDGIIRIQNAV